MKKDPPKHLKKPLAPNHKHRGQKNVRTKSHLPDILYHELHNKWQIPHFFESTYQALPEDVLNIWICQQFASISTETNSEKELRPKYETKSEKVQVLDTFGEKEKTKRLKGSTLFTSKFTCSLYISFKSTISARSSSN